MSLRNREGESHSSFGRRIAARAFVQKGLAALIALSTAPVLAHDCRVLGNGFLEGYYHGDCEEKDEIAHGQGEAKGADRYIGTFVKGRPEGRGVYTWENGARLDGTFKTGKAQGNGIYVSARGTRYDGPFEKGKLSGAKPEDCPATRGPLNC
jgi:hypothetical protein